MVRIRLMRVGKKKQPGFRLCAFDSRCPRDGAYLEMLGTYDPLTQDATKRYALKNDRILHWLSRGAKPTEAAAALLRRHKISLPTAAAKA